MGKLGRIGGIVGLAALAGVSFGSAACNSSTTINGGSSGDGGTVAINCPAPTGGPTTHTDTITADETWSAANSPHIVPNDIEIKANLTIEPCAEVQIGGGATIEVAVGGKITGEGTPSQPITIDAQDSTKPWAAINAEGGSVRLANATVSGGGLPASNDVPLKVGTFMGQSSSDTGAAAYAYSFDHVTIKDSQSDGVSLNNIGFDPASTALTITNAAQYPVRMNPPFLDSLPDGAYTGNINDAILVPAGVGNGLQIESDLTIHSRGVPYHIGDSVSSPEFRIGGGTALATVTIEAGVTFAFEKGGVLEVEHFDTSAAATGALVAKGTSASPITFTSASASPAPGDWVGIYFSSVPAASDALDYVTIDFAGADSSTIGGCPLNTEAKAALLIGSYAPSSGFLTNSNIKDSARDGIYRGWISNDIDFDGTNQFTNVPGCKETNVLTAQGVCPTSACAM